jgi:hypothetical protein
MVASEALTIEGRVYLRYASASFLHYKIICIQVLKIKTNIPATIVE